MCLSFSGKTKMLITQHNSFILLKNYKSHCSCHVFKRNGNGLTTVMAKRGDFSEKSRKEERPIFQIKVSSATLARSGIAVLGLGFIDAGYSGDWSRIGVISKEAEELLKVAAFVVVPLCIFLSLLISEEPTD